MYAEIADYLAQRVPNQAIRVLYIGGGGYTLARHIEATYPNARQEIMEIDPGVTQTVYEQLGVDPRDDQHHDLQRRRAADAQSARQDATPGSTT